MIATGVIIVITLLNVIVFKLRQLQEANLCEKLSIPPEQPCHCFSFSEIQSATQNFADALLIGQGGFGKVYKGVIHGGAITVAVKRLNRMSEQGAPEFWTEIEMLSKIRHSNIVSLIGYCNERDEMILIYEYMINGTLADHLHKIGRHGNSSTLSWMQRLKICIGAAHGLDYLHTGTGVKSRVIHRDVKSSNILLDENWAAKISDFGLSKIGPANQSCTHVSTNVRGTFGYFDLEYVFTHRLTKKSDVYAFGVVLFEVLCGRPAVDLSLNEERRGLARWAQQCIKTGTLYQIIDPVLMGQILPDSLMAFEQIADQCLNKRSKKRPTMAEVVVSLERAFALQERKDSSMLEGEIFNTGEAYDNQENSDSSVEQHDVINADSFVEQHEVINAGNGGHEELINGIRRSSDASSKQVQIDETADSSVEQQEVINASNGDEQIDGIKLLGDANNNQSRVKSSKKMAFRKKVQRFFFGTARVTSGKLEKGEMPPEKAISLSKDANQRLVFIEGCSYAFDLEDLLRASAEVLGKGTFGVSYKARLEDGTTTVVVKRLKGVSAGMGEFKQQMQVVGSIKHQNVVELRAYYFSKDEKLTVYDYYSEGSVSAMLHGKRGEEDRIPLSWEIRVRIAIGAARGIAQIHTEEGGKLVHGNIKSSNIFLNSQQYGCVSDIDLSSIMSLQLWPVVIGTTSYRAPEVTDTRKALQPSDVYSFGVFLLELLTGKSPVHEVIHLVEWVHSVVSEEWTPDVFDSELMRYPNIDEDEMVEMLQTAMACVEMFEMLRIAMACVVRVADKRPKMVEVVKMIENVWQTDYESSSTTTSTTFSATCSRSPIFRSQYVMIDDC